MIHENQLLAFRERVEVHSHRMQPFLYSSPSSAFFAVAASVVAGSCQLIPINQVLELFLGLPPQLREVRRLVRTGFEGRRISVEATDGAAMNSLRYVCH